MRLLLFLGCIGLALGFAVPDVWGLGEPCRRHGRRVCTAFCACAWEIEPGRCVPRADISSAAEVSTACAHPAVLAVAYIGTAAACLCGCCICGMCALCNAVLVAATCVQRKRVRRVVQYFRMEDLPIRRNRPPGLRE